MPPMTAAATNLQMAEAMASGTVNTLIRRDWEILNWDKPAPAPMRITSGRATYSATTAVET